MRILFSKLLEFVLVEANRGVCGSIVDVALFYIFTEASGKTAHCFSIFQNYY